MNKIIMLLLFLFFAKKSISQERDERYYLGEYKICATVGLLHYYQIFRFSGKNVEMTSIKVQGKIGNPLKKLFIIDTCTHWSGKIDSLNNGFLFSNENKLVFKVKRMTAKKLKLVFSTVPLKYTRISELVNVVMMTDKFCSCSY
jgi:hypothetical protein